MDFQFDPLPHLLPPSERANIAFVPPLCDVGGPIALVSGTSLVRELLPIWLRERGVVVTAIEYASTGGTLLRLESSKSTVLLLDMMTPDAIDIVRESTTRGIIARIVAFAIPQTSAQLLDCAAAGVAGLVDAQASCAALLAAIQTVAAGDEYCSSSLAMQLVRRHAAARVDADNGRLTQREYQIARLIHDNLANKEIGARLNIELATVKNHVHSILQKLNVKTRREIPESLPFGLSLRRPSSIEPDRGSED